MHTQPKLPPNVQQLGTDESFLFDCLTANSCFTTCCRQLELALSPYDVLRLRRAAGLSSGQFLDTYVIIEMGDEDVFPRCYLTMIDDGRESCVFVTSDGCSVYEHRPGACRTYPMGRAVVRQADGLSEFFVLLKEDHCHGFINDARQTPQTYLKSQGLEPYNRFTDMMAEIIQHEQVRQGFTLNKKQVELYLLALYNLDTFRDRIRLGELKLSGSEDADNICTLSDEDLLQYGINWIKSLFFGN